MEIIAAMIIYALAEDIKDTKATTQDLQEQIVDINDDFLRLAASHADLHARQKLDHDTHHAKIDANKQKIDDLVNTLEESFSNNN